VGLVRDLAEICRREGTSEMFAGRLQQLRREQRRKISLPARRSRRIRLRGGAPYGVVATSQRVDLVKQQEYIRARGLRV
jgi:hypothetical protein